eukprot:TRINITY_DN208_c0_g1_i5.p3 TRINITY_DN208_c0_g1~~TRINITY_DN208_c0_g1_i5.p3  ORF type:complete len:125 (-),score=23.41 TRINITY_DN208_c0_g1_i5:167-541(-)
MISSSSFSVVKIPVNRSSMLIQKITVAQQTSQIKKCSQPLIATASKPQNLGIGVMGGLVSGVAMPAFAIVDDRMNGDGTGLIFGFNDSALFWAVLGTFSLIWILYFVSQPDLGGDEDDEAGLSL